VYWFPHLHNQYLQVATELGLVGLSALLYMMYCLIRGPYRSFQEHGIAVAVGIAYLIGFMGDPYLHKQLPLVLFAVVAGLISAPGRSLWWKQ
jgi:O-antigen ligase